MVFNIKLTKHDTAEKRSFLFMEKVLAPSDQETRVAMLQCLEKVLQRRKSAISANKGPSWPI
jgi:hypothetical protein